MRVSDDNGQDPPAESTAHEVSCPHVTEGHLTETVVDCECRHGNYFLIDDIQGAFEENDARKCSKCIE